MQRTEALPRAPMRQRHASASLFLTTLMVLTLLGCLSEYDKLSMTCIGRSAIAGALGQLLALQILRSNGLK